MSNYDDSFITAFNFSMQYEVGAAFNPTDQETIDGLCESATQKRKTGYVNVDGDRGGETKFGIASNSHPDLDIQGMTLDQAMGVYFNSYWLAGKCNMMEAPLSNIYFDACVNHGVKRGTEMLQQALGEKVDGSFGPSTLNACKNVSDVGATCQTFLNVRESFFRSIVAHNASQSKFLNGWMARVKSLRDTL
jgi:lysozyme family protein